ncbi:MAG TPA: hypothetical protein VK196_04980 [Magnetospirillum sp.]|nr:hypothetical protein [Magnetospirillum sp.]
MPHADKPDPQGERQLKPADEAPMGTPGTGEALCPACGGKGSVAGQPCRECAGTGIITQGIGGA